MLEAAKQTGRIFLVGLLERSIAQYEHVHEAATAGHLGKVLSITTYRLGSYLLSEETRKHYADPALELMTLDFDFIRWMIGPPASVYATALETPGGVPGEISAILNYDSRVSATVLASGIMPKRFPFSIESVPCLRKVHSSSRPCSQKLVRRRTCFSSIPKRARNS
jgi:UDP-N-acetylglucosamine 3-dehydrogenase